VAETGGMLSSAVAERGERWLPQPSINRTKLGEEVAHYLRDALIAGVYRPGERIGIEELAEQLGVSTMPVREALVKMASEGLLDALPHRGFRVARVARTDFEDIFVIHAVISGLLAERVAQTADAALIRDLEDLQRQIQQVADQGLPPNEEGPRIEELNFLFHRRINRLAEGERLRWFLRITSQLVPRHFYAEISGWTQATVTEHQPIIDALAARDSQRARRLMDDHVLNAGRLVVAHLEARGFFEQGTDVEADNKRNGANAQ
jgi:DNA-binding GntR family transcriptional regulator